MKYAELHEYIIVNGDIRLSVNRPLRDKIINMVVEEWPVGCREDELAQVLMDRIAGRLAGQYASVILTFILYILVSQVVQLAIEWFLERLANRELMMQYHAQASGNL